MYEKLKQFRQFKQFNKKGYNCINCIYCIYNSDNLTYCNYNLIIVWLTKQPLENGGKKYGKTEKH